MKDACAPAPSEPPVAIRKWRILVADDDEGMRCLSSNVLSDTGFDVHVACDGEQAWDALCHGHFDLLITDNDMPRLTGMKLIERIRETGMQLPVIIASGSVLTASAHESPQLQIAAVLSKPFSIAELINAARFALFSFDRNDGRAERHGSPARHVAAREWSFSFQHETTSAPLPAPAPQPNTSKAHPHRILIADDDAVVRGSLAAVLESEGFAVDEAQNGVETVSRVIAHPPDLVLLDLNMPRWDGWTAFSQLERVTPLLPVIVITARPNQYRKAVQLGVDAFMEKPLNIPVLVRAVKRLSREDERRHVHRITNHSFVTELLGSNES
jgi:CheY-like chemotaxis protein